MRNLILALALAACAAQTPPPPAAEPSPLAGTSWVEATRALRPPTLEFADAAPAAAGFAGCNRWFAQAEIDGETLRFAAIGATRMACEPAMMTIDRNFLDALENTRSYSGDADSLVLLDEAGAETARFIRAR
jgi:heat shock protein HslJ